MVGVLLREERGTSLSLGSWGEGSGNPKRLPGIGDTGLCLEEQVRQESEGQKKMSQVEGTEAHSGDVRRGWWEWGRM